MTRKDYVAVAAAMKALRPVMNQGYYGLWCADSETLDAVSAKIAAVMADDNPRFDRARFLRECGVQS